MYTSTRVDLRSMRGIRHFRVLSSKYVGREGMEFLFVV